MNNNPNDPNNIQLKPEWMQSGERLTERQWYEGLVFARGPRHRIDPRSLQSATPYRRPRHYIGGNHSETR